MGYAARRNPRAAEGKGLAAANRARLEAFLRAHVTSELELELFAASIAENSADYRATLEFLRPMCARLTTEGLC